MSDWHIVETCDDDGDVWWVCLQDKTIVAECYTKEDAQQIVADARAARFFKEIAERGWGLEKQANGRWLCHGRMHESWVAGGATPEDAVEDALKRSGV